MTEAVRRTPTQILVRVVLIVVCAGLAAMWVYAFVFASKEGVYRVSDDAWRAAALDLCEAARDERVALADTDEGYIENPTEAQMLERADVVDEATDILERMLDSIVALPLTGAKDITRVEVWEGHYRTLIEDRRRYTAKLRDGQLEPYVETMVGEGPVTNVLTDFTSGNGIKACAPPGELGGDV